MPMLRWRPMNTRSRGSRSMKRTSAQDRSEFLRPVANTTLSGGSLRAIRVLYYRHRNRATAERGIRQSQPIQRIVEFAGAGDQLLQSPPTPRADTCTSHTSPSRRVDLASSSLTRWTVPQHSIRRFQSSLAEILRECPSHLRAIRSPSLMKTRIHLNRSWASRSRARWDTFSRAGELHRATTAVRGSQSSGSRAIRFSSGGASTPVIRQ